MHRSLPLGERSVTPGAPWGPVEVFDRLGSTKYNQKLSMRRAEAVKAYIVSKGVDASRVYTEGKGESQPVADNKTAEGRAKNRRVEIEVVGTRANK